MADIHIIERTESSALIIRDTVGMFQLAKVMGPAYQKIMDYLKEKKVDCPNSPFTSYKVDNWEETVNMGGLRAFFSMFSKKWEIEMGFQVPDAVMAPSGMELIRLPAGKCYESLHVGPYQKVGQVYKAIYQRSRTDGMKLAGHSYEFYRNSPKEVPKDKLETRILVPIV